MRIFIKSLLTIIVVLFVLVAGGLIYLVNMDPNNHKERIASLVENNTGLVVHFNGDIALDFYPWLGISVESAIVDNPPGYGEEHMMRLDSAEFRVMLMPALRGRYEIDTVRVYGADINLIVNEQGVGNWETLSGDDSTRTEPSDESDGVPLGDIVLGGVDIRDGRIGFEDRARQQRYEINNLSASTGELVYGEPISLNLSLDGVSSQPELQANTRLNGVIAYDDDGQRYEISPLILDMTLSGPGVPDGSADVRLSTTVQVDLAADTLTIPELELSGLGLSLVAQLNGRGVQTDRPYYQGGFQLSGDDLAVLFTIAEMDELAGRIASLDSPGFDVSGNLSLNQADGDIEVSTLDARLLGATVEGRLSAIGMGTDNALINAALNAEGPDLPALVQVIGQITEGRDSAMASLGQQLGSVSNRGFVIDTEFDINLEQGDIDLPMLRAETLGLELDAQLAARDIESDTGSVTGHLRLGGRNLRDVLVALDQGDLAEVLRDLNLETSLDGNRNDLAITPLALNLTLAGPSVVNSPQTVSLNAAGRVNMNQETVNIDQFTLNGMGLEISGDGVLVNVLEAPEFEGQLDVAAFNLRSLLQQLNLEVPDTADPNVLQQVALQTRFSGSGERIAGESLTLTLDETMLTGQFSISDFERPAATFALSIDSLDADRYLPEPAAEQQELADEDSVELPVDLLRTLTAEGSLDIGRLTLAGTRLENISASMNAADGQLTLAPLSTDLYQGRYQGELALDVSSEIPQARVESALTGVELGPLLMDLMDATYLTGTGTVQLSLTSTGGSVDALMRNLDGTGELDVSNGVLRGVNIGNTLAQVETMIRSQRVASLNRGDETRFDQFSASLDITQGAVRSNNLLILAPGFQVSGEGLLADLGDQRIDFDLVASVDRSTATRGDQEYDLGGYSLPISCTGQLDGPRCAPDFESVVRRALGSAIERRLGDFLERRLGPGQNPD